MNNAISQFTPKDHPTGSKPQPDHASAAYAREVSFKARESSSSELVIQTREGDRVTLSAGSFSQLDAYSYTSEGVARTESGAALSSQQVREITLASGERYAFTVSGDLSDSEMADIEAIVKGLDSVMAEMKEGDMAEAMDKALGIGSYDSIASYSADLSYSASYELRAETAAASSLADSADSEDPGQGKGPRLDFDRFFHKFATQLKAHENQLLGKARAPIDSIFKHHLSALEEGGGEQDDPLVQLLDEARRRIDELLGRVTETPAEQAEPAEPTEPVAPTEPAAEQPESTSI